MDDGNVKIDGNADVTLRGKTSIYNGTLTIEEGSTLTNSGNLTCSFSLCCPQMNTPPLISVYGKLTNDENRLINASINIAIYYPPDSPEPNTVTGYDIYLEKGSSFTNSGTIKGNIIQETGSSLTNSGTINE